ncbi:hypothetical protein BH09SUM1_BH09SUM1_19350 [soil metagenome]
MNISLKNKLKMLFAGAVLFAAVAGCTATRAQPTSPPKAIEKVAATASAPAPAAPVAASGAPVPGPVIVPVNLTLPPASTFATSCIRCHGVDGTKRSSGAWSQTTARRLAIVSGMMRKRAKLDPSVADIEAMGSYVQSLRGGSFAAIVNGADFASGKTAKLLGDATEGSKVTLIKDGKETPIELTKSAWSLDAPPKAPFTIKAENGAMIAEFTFPQKQWAFAANPANTVDPSANPAADASAPSAP